MGFKFNFKHEGLNKRILADVEDRKKQDQQIKTTLANEGQDLSEKVFTALYKYMDNNGLTKNDKIVFTMTDCISWLKNHVDDFRTSIPVSGRDWSDTMSNCELNVHNLVPALRQEFTAKRVTVLWAWEDVFDGEVISDTVTPRQILAHDNAKIKIVIKERVKVEPSRQYLVGENFGGIKGEAPADFSCNEDLFEGMTF